jgi:cysteine desulfurase
MPGSSDHRVYLDYNATAPVRRNVMAAVAAAFDTSGNPSSVHGEGRSARMLVEDTRDVVAGWIGATPDRIVFTAGGTEANNTALRMAAGGGRTIIASAIEHDSVLRCAADLGGPVVVPVGRDGRIAPERVEHVLGTVPRPAMLSVMLVNNETGIVQPVQEIAAVAHAHGVQVHCDAVQAAGRMDIDVRTLGADYLTLSGHKIGGPQGVGVLVVPGEGGERPLLIGGAQERGRRAGTENVAAIAGFGAAIRDAVSDPGERGRVAALRDRLEGSVRARVPGSITVGSNAPRVGNTSCIAVPGEVAETLVILLDLAGIAVSAGAACSSGKVVRSHVLTAMGLPEWVSTSAIRVSLGWASTEGDVDRFVDTLAAVSDRPKDRRTERRPVGV